MEWGFFGGFCALLFASVAWDLHILWALLGGYLLFFLYGLLRGHRPRALLTMSAQGIHTVKNILFLFLLIGMTTGLWRGSGTIAYLIYHAAELVSPALLPLLAFLLCSGMSFLTGTSFGTAATIGTLCMAMANTLGLSPVLSAGAILSGSFFGDRCSPMSTSALLVAALTETDLYENLKGMVRTAAIPFLLTCGLYWGAGLLHREGTLSPDLLAPFAQGFALHWTTVLPAAAILLLSLLKCKVRYTMGVGILLSAGLCLFLQGMAPAELLRTALLGYAPALPELQGLLSGGGVVSMLKPFCIVCISSTFSGLFEGTGMLDGMKDLTHRLAQRLTPFGGLLVVSVFTSLIACNQTLSILLSHALCREDWEARDLAMGLENTAVVLAPLVPWSIAGAVPLAALGAPNAALFAAFYLYLIPLWNLLLHCRKRAVTAKSR